MLKYIGTGDYIAGVPARDLSDDDLAEAEQKGWGQEALIETGLYAAAPTDEKE